MALMHARHERIPPASLLNFIVINKYFRFPIQLFPKPMIKNIKKDIDLIIYSPAIPKSNSELKEAKRLKIKTLTYPEALGELTEEYYTIARAGTHGKSTTTAITSLILEESKKDPTVVVGTKMREFENRNYRVGDSSYLVVEACEYKRSFMELHPNMLIITNIEADHLDYCKDLSDYMSAFSELANKVPEDGTIIINGDEKNSNSNMCMYYINNVLFDCNST